MASIQTAAGSGVDNPAFSTILTNIASRIVNTTDLSADKVRIVAAPNEKLHQYLAEPGVLVRVRAPEPESLSGAGRTGTIVRRRVDCVIGTLSLHDQAGSDAIAVARHSDTEEAVLDALLPGPVRGVGAGSSYNLPVGRTIHWVPGGDDIVRQIKTDAAMLVSALCFVVTYPVRATVYRD